jgi:hypothetical protein
VAAPHGLQAPPRHTSPVVLQFLPLVMHVSFAGSQHAPAPASGQVGAAAQHTSPPPPHVVHVPPEQTVCAPEHAVFAPTHFWVVGSQQPEVHGVAPGQQMPLVAPQGVHALWLHTTFVPWQS